MLAVTGVLALLGSASASLVSPTIPGAYIVKYRNDATAEWEAAKSFFASPEAQQGANKFTVKYEYSIGEHFKGFALRADGPGAQAALQSMPGVEFAEPERIGEIDDSRTDCTQEDATWGLDRLDQQALPLDKLYKHQCEAGEDVLAFIADTGIYPNEDLEGRIVEHQCFPSNDPNCDADCQGHGTHVAGTVGSKTWGVAKKVKFVGVKVCQRCSGSCSQSEVIKGVEFAVDYHTKNAKRKFSVMNMSLGFRPPSSTINAAIAAAAQSGIFPAVSAGNSRGDACNQSPASEPLAFAVMASTSDDERASFSNYGMCGAIYAPGASIVSLAPRDSGTATMSGTSMASPHVCGAAAAAISEFEDQFSDTEDIGKFLRSKAVEDAIKDPGADTENYLLNTLWQ